ncbi:MAG TPA: hypothetical protein VFB52_02495 [Solirubrobacterales bacterium]|nr:hypothetical protein [Solirubrobacterales bacterium]
MTEHRVSARLGLTPAEAELLIGRAVERLGRRGYELRACAFLLATGGTLRPAIPRRLRLRAIRAFLHCLLGGASENLLYAGAIGVGTGR